MATTKTLTEVADLILTALENSNSLNGAQRASIFHARALLEGDAEMADVDLEASQAAAATGASQSAGARASLLVGRANAAAQAPQDELDALSAPPAPEPEDDAAPPAEADGSEAAETTPAGGDITDTDGGGADPNA